ncbi:MAG: hypothetical protein VKJ44_09420 [Synechococcus sp.]|nr:hypothetical protein [Synechococcus sp.]
MNQREINSQLIRGLFDQELGRQLQLLETSDSELRCLSPLARAAYLLLSGGELSRALAEQALAATFLIASDDAEGLLEGGCICTAEQEEVVHGISIEIQTRDSCRSLDLGFVSCGAVQSMLGGDAPLTAWLRLNCLQFQADNLNPLTAESLLATYQSQAQKQMPSCYPCDTDFIGSIAYTLSSIGEHHVDGPCLCDQKNSLEWLDTGLLDELPDADRFCWLQQLTRTQAESLGLTGGQGRHHSPGLPEWLSDQIEFSKLWISRDDLYKSYSKGRVTCYKVDQLLLCLGAGPEWIPGDLDSQVDELAADQDCAHAFPATQMPLLVLSFTRESSRVFSYIQGSFCENTDFIFSLALLSKLLQIYHGYLPEYHADQGQ